MAKPRIPIHLSIFARSSLIVAAFFGLDKIIGFVRTLIVNRMFGLSYELDVFNAANNIPDLLSSLISGGALGVALIPVLSEYIQSKGRPSAWEIFSKILNLAFIATGILAILLAIMAPVLVPTVIAPGFPFEQQALTVQLMRLDLIAIMIFSISGLVMAGLQANQHFLLPALAPGLYNVGQIFGALVLADRFGLGIRGLVYGVIIGAILHLAIQIPGLLKYDFRWTPSINIDDPGVKKVLRLIGPRIATMFFIQLFFIVRDNLASSQGEGAVTALNLGWFIMQFPETLLGTAIAIALLPTISELFASGQMESFKQTINGAVKAVAALTIPAGLLLIVTLEPLVQLAFDFPPSQTAQVVLAAQIYLLGLTGHALLEISVRSFYAQQDALTPLLAAALNSLAYILLASYLASAIGFPGIAIANSVVFTTEAIALVWLLNRRFPGILAARRTIIRVLTATLLAAAISAGGVSLARSAFAREDFVAFGALAALALGSLLVLPFVWPELKLMARLGEGAAAKSQAINPE